MSVPAIPRPISQLPRRNYRTLVAFWGEVALNIESPDVEASLWNEPSLESIIANHADVVPTSLPTTGVDWSVMFFKEVLHGRNKAVILGKAAEVQASAGREMSSYILRYQASLVAALSLSLLFGVAPYRMRRNASTGVRQGSHYLIDLIDSIEGSQNHVNFLPTSELSHKEYWALARYWAETSMNRSVKFKSASQELQHCDYGKVGENRHHLEYRLTTDIRSNSIVYGVNGDTRECGYLISSGSLRGRDTVKTMLSAAASLDVMWQEIVASNVSVQERFTDFGVVT